MNGEDIDENVLAMVITAMCPNGSIEFPAKTCYEIKRCHPDAENGTVVSYLIQ